MQPVRPFQTRRRMLLAGLGLLAAAGRAPAQAQAGAHRVGFLYFASRASAYASGRVAAFLASLRSLGRSPDKDFSLVERYADSDPGRLRQYAAELAALHVDVVVATGNPAVRAMRRASKAIPIVSTVSSDPVGAGLASSLAHPGGNVTGLYDSSIELVSKQMELLVSVLPDLNRVAVLMSSVNVTHPARLKVINGFAHGANMKVLPLACRNAADIAPAFEAMARDRVGAVLILGDTMFVQEAKQVADLALRHRIPSIYVSHDFPDAGGLLSYGEDIVDNFRLAAGYVDKILAGASPADLPFARSSRIELTFNKTTAAALGLKLPPELVLRADRIVE
jgi:putative ABC transport system substrate-binding protein